MAVTGPTRSAVVLLGIKLVLMSLTSGCMDIFSYRILGQVFTSAMTGNAALLGFDLGQGDIAATSRNMAAFTGFLIGLVIGAAVLRVHPAKPGWFRAMTCALLVEEMLLVAFAALLQLAAGPSFDRLLYGLIGLSAVAMGVQSIVSYHVGVPGVTTTYFTGTLTNIVVGLVGSRSPRPPAQQPPRLRWPCVAFLAYVAGAALTGLLLLEPRRTLMLPPKSALPTLPAVVMAIVLLVSFADDVSGHLRLKQAERRSKALRTDQP